jgi:hypothetical protein
MNSQENYSIALIQLLFLVAFVLPYVLYIYTMYKTMNTISIQNQQMKPGLIWLLLIPYFNLIWQFAVVNKLSNSILRECQRLNIEISHEKPTNDIGNIFAILSIAGLMPIIGIFFLTGAFICWIVYWVQVSKFRKRFIENKNNDLLDIERDLLNKN